MSPEPVFTLAAVRATQSDAIVPWDRAHPARSGLEGLRKLGGWALWLAPRDQRVPGLCVPAGEPGHVGVDCGAVAT